MNPSSFIIVSQNNGLSCQNAVYVSSYASLKTICTRQKLQGVYLPPWPRSLQCRRAEQCPAYTAPSHDVQDKADLPLPLPLLSLNLAPALTVTWCSSQQPVA